MIFEKLNLLRILRSIAFIGLVIFCFIFENLFSLAKPQVSEYNYKYYSGLGNKDANKVIIVVQGGPITSLETEYVMAELSEVVFENAYVVMPHQYQTLHPQLFIKKEITFEQSKNFNNQSVEILDRVIKQFSEKRVYLIGISYGVFLAENYFSKHGRDQLEGVALIVGRLDFEDEFWQAFSRGEPHIYKNGETIAKLENYEEAGMEGGDINLQKNMPKIAAGSGYKNYLVELKDLNFEKFIFAYGLRDEQVGRLRDDEIKFLEDRGVAILTHSEGHGETVEEYFPQIAQSILEF